MSGHQDGASQTTHRKDQLQAAETPADQIAQAVAVIMDKLAATGQELAEYAAQLRNLSTWPRHGAAHGERQAPAEAHGPVAAAGQRRGEASGPHRNPDSRLIEMPGPARPHAGNGTHHAQAHALQPRDERRPPAGKREIAAKPHDAMVIPLQSGLAMPADHQDLAEVTPATPHTHREQDLDLLDWTISTLYHIGLMLLPAARQHSETAQRTAEALQCLDDTICRLRDHVLNAHANGR